MTLLSVIICAHNPRPNHLDRVLQGLRAQTLLENKWELLLIDNASDRILANDWDLSWHPQACHIREDELGLSVARQRGIREASANLLVFVDDDNVLDPNYLEEALRISSQWPELGAWSGSLIPEFEIDPSEHLRKYAEGLMSRERACARWSNVLTCFEAEPCGAGLCVRSVVALAYCRHYEETKIRLTDRAGKDLISGGDTEICYIACNMGLGMGIFPDLRVTHLIPVERVAERYLIKLSEGIKTSRLLLSYKWSGIAPKSPLTFIELLRLVKNFGVRSGLDRKMYLAGLRATFRARAVIARASHA